MTMTREKAELVAVLAEANCSQPKQYRQSPQFIAAAARKLMRLGAESRTLAERLCNESLSEEYYEKKKASIDRRVSELLESSIPRGFKTFTVGDDPRGYTLKIRLSTDRYNTLGGSEDGWGVPNS